jgi:hypothetical protein
VKLAWTQEKEVNEETSNEKIVIISRPTEINYHLIVNLHALFPECEIDIVFSEMQGVESFPYSLYSESPITDETFLNHHASNWCTKKNV